MTINSKQKQNIILFFLISLGIASCIPYSSQRSIQAFLQENKQDPALSGNGEKLALIIGQSGQQTVQIRSLKSGTVLPLRHLSRHQPHSSPSLSWSGRYLAVIIQRGNRRTVVIEDRLKGRLHSIVLSGNRNPINTEISPEARRIAIQFSQGNKPFVEVFDLSGIIEPEFLK